MGRCHGTGGGRRKVHPKTAGRNRQQSGHGAPECKKIKSMDKNARDQRQTREYVEKRNAGKAVTADAARNLQSSRRLIEAIVVRRYGGAEDFRG